MNLLTQIKTSNMIISSIMKKYIHNNQEKEGFLLYLKLILNRLYKYIINQIIYIFNF